MYYQCVTNSVGEIDYSKDFDQGHTYHAIFQPQAHGEPSTFYLYTNGEWKGISKHHFFKMFKPAMPPWTVAPPKQPIELL